MTIGHDSLRAAVDEALRRVHDPCSIAAGVPIDVVDMGLVKGLTFDDGLLGVTLGVTSISCRMVAQIADAAQAELSAIDGIRRVDISIDTTTTWTEADMAEAARARLTRRRANARLLVRPQQWRDRQV
jgi:metal-sulfur cluster biosynthetic enzyme